VKNNRQVCLRLAKLDLAEYVVWNAGELTSSTPRSYFSFPPKISIIDNSTNMLWQAHFFYCLTKVADFCVKSS
jgi:hypothetical protein